MCVCDWGTVWKFWCGVCLPEGVVIVCVFARCRRVEPGGDVCASERTDTQASTERSQKQQCKRSPSLEPFLCARARKGGHQRTAIAEANSGGACSTHEHTRVGMWGRNRCGSFAGARENVNTRTVHHLNALPHAIQTRDTRALHPIESSQSVC